MFYRERRDKGATEDLKVIWLLAVDEGIMTESMTSR